MAFVFRGDSGETRRAVTDGPAGARAYTTRARRLTAWSLLIGSLLASGSASLAQYVRVQPPPPVVERPYAAPGRGYVWIEGYQRWDGHRYVWVGGRWVHPPRPAAVWEPGRWVRGAGGWQWVPGRWRG